MPKRARRRCRRCADVARACTSKGGAIPLSSYQIRNFSNPTASGSPGWRPQPVIWNIFCTRFQLVDAARAERLRATWGFARAQPREAPVRRPQPAIRDISCSRFQLVDADPGPPSRAGASGPARAPPPARAPRLTRGPLTACDPRATIKPRDPGQIVRPVRLSRCMEGVVWLYWEHG